MKRQKAKGEKVYIPTNLGKRLIGEFRGNIFFKMVSRSKHLFKKLNAWGIDAEVFSRTIIGRADIIKIYDREEKRTYTATIHEFQEHGQYLQFNPHRAQIFLGLQYFN